MSMTDYKAAVALVGQHPEHVVYVGAGCGEARIAEAEQALGMPLPPTYRRFLADFGSILFVGDRIYGIKPDGPIDDPASYAVWVTLKNRAAGWLPPQLVIIAQDGMGGDYVLDGRAASPGAEYPVAIRESGLREPDGSLEVVAPDFGAFFLDRVREWL